MPSYLVLPLNQATTAHLLKSG